MFVKFCKKNVRKNGNRNISPLQKRNSNNDGKKRMRPWQKVDGYLQAKIL